MILSMFVFIHMRRLCSHLKIVTGENYFCFHFSVYTQQTRNVPVALAEGYN